jgi:hypothetical protein
MNKLYIVSPFENKIENRGLRNEILAKLASNHFSVEYLTTNFSHSRKCQLDIPGDYTVFHTLGYSNNISIRRILVHCSLALRIFYYLQRKATNNDIIFVSSIPPEIYFLISFLKCKLVIDVRDLWPEAFKNTLHSSLFTIWYTFLQKYISKFNLVITPIPGFQKILTQRYGIDVKLRLLGWTGHQLGDRFGREFCVKDSSRPDVLDIVYIGNLSYLCNLKDFIIEISKHKRLQFHVVGDGAFKNVLEKVSSENIFYYGYLDKGDVWKLTRQCDFLLLPNFAEHALPNKLFDCFSLGLPALHWGQGDTANFVEENQIGIVANNEKDLVRLISTVTNAKYEVLLKSIALKKSKFSTESQLLQLMQDLEGLG